MGIFAKPGFIRIAVLALLLLTAREAYAQWPEVSVSPRSETIGEVLRDIRRQTGYKFAINHDELDVDTKVAIRKTTAPLDEILTQALAGTGHVFSIEEHMQVFIVRSAEQPEQPAAAPAPAPEPVRVMPFEIPIATAPEQTEDFVIERILVGDTPPEVPSRVDFLPRAGKYDRTAKSGSKVALKANLLYGAATLTPNLGIEIGLGARSSLNIMGAYNPWNREGDEQDNKKFVHWMVQPEFRYWFCERMSGHYVGVYALGSMFNVADHDFMNYFDREYRYEGWAVGAGLSYGYTWAFHKRWGLEFYIGAGVTYLDYDKWEHCDWCADRMSGDGKTRFGITKAGITLSFILK